MLSTLNSAWDAFKYSAVGYPLWQYWQDIQDPRTAHFFLIRGCGPWATVAIMSVYLYFVLRLGPKMMENRPPVSAKLLRPIMLVYNLSMAASNAFFVYLILDGCNYGRRFIDWKYPDHSDTSPRALWELNMAWWYWMTKFLDLFDTVFLVLKKRFSAHPAPGLHLYHHTVVPIFGAICLIQNAIIPGSALFGLINGSIHVIMYSYYGLASLGPAIRPYLWWKRYITQLQIGQFIFGLCYGVVLGILQEGYPVFWFWFAFSQGVLFLLLFADFYRRSYNKASSSKKALNGSVFSVAAAVDQKKEE